MAFQQRQVSRIRLIDEIGHPFQIPIQEIGLPAGVCVRRNFMNLVYEEDCHPRNFKPATRGDRSGFQTVPRIEQSPQMVVVSASYSQSVIHIIAGSSTSPLNTISM